MIDRCTKWPEAVPVQDITAETVAKAMYEGWISRFGCPARITTDQGRQFESSLFKALTKKFGITRIRTSPYHPQANSQVERFHRGLKAALMARGAGSHWSEELPTVMLGLRTAIREDTQFSPALMTYGTTLRIPSDFFEPTQPKIDDAEYVRRLVETMASFTPVSKSHANNRNIFVHKDLASCTHVFVRNDTVRKPLTPPYDGPYKVLHRSDKLWTIQMPNRTATISVDRLKPAYVINSEETTRTQLQASPKNVSTELPPLPGPRAPPDTYVTRSGRAIKRTVRLA